MKISKQPIIILVIAIILGAGIIRWDSVSPVSPCIKTAGCENTNLRGKLTTQQWGFPATYREISKFEPSNRSAYVETSVESQKTNIVLIAVNTVFWYALLTVTASLLQRLRRAKNNN